MILYTEAKIETYQFLNDNLDRQLSWIDKSDIRLAFIAPLSLAMLASLASKTPVITEWSIAIWMWLLFSTFFLFLTLIFCVCATFPRTDGKKDSVVFFGEIIKKDIDTFADEILIITEADVLKDLVYQIYINAEIASIKYGWIQKSLFTLILASVFWLFAIYTLWSI